MNPETMLRLYSLMESGQWQALRDDALEVLDTTPEDPDAHGFVAHALRKLGEVEAAWTWASRGHAYAPRNLFVLNRVTLTGNLTKRYEQVIAAGTPVLDAEPTTPGDQLNFAIIITNLIYAWSHLGRVNDAVTVLSPVLARFEHAELHFNVACLYALAKDDRALAFMEKSLSSGKDKQSFAESDFDLIREDPRFDDLLAREWVRETEALARAGLVTRAALRPDHFLDPQRFVDDVSGPELINDELINTIINRREDDGPSAVYADWLEEHDHPRSRAIALALRCERATNESQRMVACAQWSSWVETHARSLLGPTLDLLRTTPSEVSWRRGFIDSIVFNGFGDEGAFEDQLGVTLKDPTSRLLHTVHVGDVGGEIFMDYTGALAIVSANAPVSVRELIVMPSPVRIDPTRLSTKGLAKAMPRLTSLTLGGRQVELEPLTFPSLKSFTLKVQRVSAANLDAINGPTLASLDLTLGFMIETNETIHAVLERLPALTHLTLRHCQRTDALVQWLINSPLAARLESLSFPDGDLTEAGTTKLTRAHFPKLISR